jgi:hypothetical protein
MPRYYFQLSDGKQLLNNHKGRCVTALYQAAYVLMHHGRWSALRG